MTMIEKKQREKYLISYPEIERVIESAKDQAAREASEDTAYAMDVIEILAAEVVRLREWGMWTLSPEDVEHIADRELTADELQDVRHYFRKGFEANQSNWTEIVKQAIDEVI